jgi:hypothetical protein
MKPPYERAQGIIDFGPKHSGPSLESRWPVIKKLNYPVWPGYATMHVVQDTEAGQEEFWGAITCYGEEHGPDPSDRLHWRRMEKVVEVTYKEIGRHEPQTEN